MDQIKQLLSTRMMWGIYLGQYCVNALTYFFITWFPVYLVQARGMSILKAGFIAFDVHVNQRATFGDVIQFFLVHARVLIRLMDHF